MELSGFPLLSLYVFAPVLGMAAVLCVPKSNDKDKADANDNIIKTIACAAAAIPLIIGAYVFFAFSDNGLIHFYESRLWIGGGLNTYYKLGMDGISAPMVVLSGLVGFISVVASWGIKTQVKGYFALILLLLAGMNGVFTSLDFFLFYVFWELMLLPMYFLIGIWGGPNRIYAAIKFFLYTMAGSVLMLVAMLALWYWSDANYNTDPAHTLSAKTATVALYKPLIEDAAKQKAALQTLDAAALSTTYRIDISSTEHILKNFDAFKAAAAPNAPAAVVAAVPLQRTFDLLQLKARYALFLEKFVFFGRAFTFATLMFVFLYIAFAIKVPVFPFHTWLPWAHVEAPTAISVILAGILLKMGVYGFLRIGYPIFPQSAVHFAVPIALFGVFNIIYGACCALAQDDLKKIVAYSSVSHMGYCMLGLASLTTAGITGSVLQMFNHGTSTSMMFLLVGVIYDRAHHRDVNRFGGLAQQMPVYAALFTVALFASMGLPGLSGFISEILVFLGAFYSNLGSGPWARPHVDFTALTAISAIGVVLTAAYLLWMMQRVFFGPLNKKIEADRSHYPDVNGRELFTLIPLVIVVIALGIYPQPLINLTQKSSDDLSKFVIANSGYPELKSAEKQTSGAEAKPKVEGEKKSEHAH